MGLRRLTPLVLLIINVILASMPAEILYKERTATVVGGGGALGSKITRGLRSLGFKEVLICEQGDPFREFVAKSDTIFFAVNGDETEKMVSSADDLLKPPLLILDGASGKSGLISLYQDLDRRGISTCSTHLGAVPAQPWRGVKVWLCDIGPNSSIAQRLARDIFISENSYIVNIGIEDHRNVELVQCCTFIEVYTFAAALRRLKFPLSKFYKYAPLNGELAALLLGRTLGQDPKTPTEIVISQPRLSEFVGAMEEGWGEIKEAMKDEKKLKDYMEEVIHFHNNQAGTVGSVFKQAGSIGAMRGDLRNYSMEFTIKDDIPGELRRVLAPFNRHNANLTAIFSVPGTIIREQSKENTDWDETITFCIGVDPKTIDSVKQEMIQKELEELGCAFSKG